MRLDKFIAENTGLTRSQATKVIRQSAVKINVVFFMCLFLSLNYSLF